MLFHFAAVAAAKSLIERLSAESRCIVHETEREIYVQIHYISRLN